jgi:hypothetical protein
MSSQALSSRPVEPGQEADFINRELVPVVIDVRALVVARLGFSVAVDADYSLRPTDECSLCDAAAFRSSCSQRRA